VAAELTGLTISTFGGNPVTATAARAVLDFTKEHNLRAANCK
jgi:4-aminobutyrate aminotransferase-like enzyme